MSDEPLTSNPWGTRERLNAFLNHCRHVSQLGYVEIDFELVKEALAEIERLEDFIMFLKGGDTSLINGHFGRYGITFLLQRHHSTKCTVELK